MGNKIRVLIEALLNYTVHIDFIDVFLVKPFLPLPNTNISFHMEWKSHFVGTHMMEVSLTVRFLIAHVSGEPMCKDTKPNRHSS